ncbi:MAG: hypothetical protein J1F63_00280 [Oscillospiraceae bacterium]|nr:hypothetical protein [Oscillospiraceae bacterium]
MSYLITQTLIGSWNYMHSCREECQKDAYNDFLRTLNRIPQETTPAMQNGIDFENEVYKAAAGISRTAHPKWESGINAVAAIIKGAPVQVKAQRELTIGSMDLLVYGIMDAIKAGKIYDVKFSNKSFSSVDLAGKYLDSPQHPTYFYLEPEAQEFQYLVSDGVDLYTEVYTRGNSRPFKEIAEEFLSSLDAMNLLDAYKENWEAR